MLNRKLVMNPGIEKVAVMLLAGTLAASISISPLLAQVNVVIGQFHAEGLVEE